MDSTYTDADFIEECEALEENPAPKSKDFEQFATQCAKSGLSARWRHDTHWQIQKAGKALVDFWPTANKVRPCQCKNKEKARRGNAADAIALAMMLTPKTAKAPKETEDRKARRERIATAAMAGLISTYCDPGCPFPKAQMIAETSVEYADSLIAELDKSEVTP